MPRHFTSIVQASVEIHGGCNFKCQMCPQTSGREKSFLKILPLNLFSKIINQLVEAGCQTVNLQGSGEPLLNTDLPMYVQIAKRAGLNVSIVTNGYRLNGSIAKGLLEEGLDEVRVSVVGYNPETYKFWMGHNAFDAVYRNTSEFIDLIAGSANNCRLSSYHLILNREDTENECKEYRENWINPLGVSAEIWTMHNWSGRYDAGAYRNKGTKRSCGRPFAPYLNVRAGGLNGHHGAVVPCCFVLGNDSRAVMGHLDESTISEVLNNDKYKKFREAHSNGDFEQLEACRNCDQLYESPESLVWSNIAGKAYGQIKNNPALDFRDYKQA